MISPASDDDKDDDDDDDDDDAGDGDDVTCLTVVNGELRVGLEGYRCSQEHSTEHNLDAENNPGAIFKLDSAPAPTPTAKGCARTQ